MPSVRELLAGAGALPVEDPRRDGEILLGHCLGRDRSWLYTWPEREVAAADAGRYRELLQRRAAGEPVAYLTGEREFWSLRLKVNRHTLIPRPETETLVEWSLQLPLPVNAAALDLGAGSGAIALALASERPGWEVTAVDRSERALQVARDNAVRLELSRVKFSQSDWYASVVGRYHLLVSNPPYVAEGDPHLQRGDLRFEPGAALVSPGDGLADIVRLLEGARAHLHRGGWMLVEHGATQAGQVRELFACNGFEQIATRRDLAGLERITGGCMNAV